MKAFTAEETGIVDVYSEKVVVSKAAKEEEMYWESEVEVEAENAAEENPTDEVETQAPDEALV